MTRQGPLIGPSEQFYAHTWTRAGYSVAATFPCGMEYVYHAYGRAALSSHFGWQFQR